MKKILTFMLGICLILPCAFLFSACKEEEKSTMESWDGTSIQVSEAVEGVVTIETAEELAGLAESVNNGFSFEGITIKLTCDMDLLNKQWIPIGFGSSNGLLEMDTQDSCAFKGIFDGQNHTIHNLKITTFIGGGFASNASSGVGLFGHIIAAEVKNVNVNNANVVGNHFVGAVVGFASGSQIENCKVTNSQITCNYVNGDESGDKAGAVVAHIQNSKDFNSSIKNCSAYNSTVSADRDAGRVLGCASINNYGSNSTTTFSNLTSDSSVNVVYNETGKGIKSSSGTNFDAQTDEDTDGIGRKNIQ
jgi:hypothetical protein